MPEISRFYGIVIKMYFAVDTLAVISGRLPARAMGLVAEWATRHQQELSELWAKATRLGQLHRLDPLP